MKIKKVFFILHFSWLSLSLNKISCNSAKKKNKLFLFCTHFALSLQSKALSLVYHDINL